jgi:hypothetical protein
MRHTNNFCSALLLVFLGQKKFLCIGGGPDPVRLDTRIATLLLIETTTFDDGVLQAAAGGGRAS